MPMYLCVTAAEPSQKAEPKARPNEWGFSNKMLDLTRHMDKVRKA